MQDRKNMTAVLKLCIMADLAQCAGVLCLHPDELISYVPVEALLHMCDSKAMLPASCRLMLLTCCKRQ